MQFPEQAVLTYDAKNIPVYIGQPGRTIGYQLAPSTNSQGYRPGAMLARVTTTTTVSGVTYVANTLINYNPASTTIPGQNVCTNILIDPDLTITFPAATYFGGTVKTAMAKGSWIIRAQFLYATATNLSDVATGLTDLGAIAQYIDGELVYLI